MAIMKKFKKEEVVAFVATLSTPNYEQFTAADIEKISDWIQSDGCTGVLDIYRPACIKHDFHYTTHLDFSGEPITKWEADRRFRVCIQGLSGWKKLSPVSWWRWLGVTTAGWLFW